MAAPDEGDVSREVAVLLRDAADALERAGRSRVARGHRMRARSLVGEDQDAAQT